MKSVLFLGTDNASRSQMAEALLRSRSGDRIEVASAGLRPTEVHPLALRVMAEVGIDISGQRAEDPALLRAERRRRPGGIAGREGRRPEDARRGALHPLATPGGATRPRPAPLTRSPAPAGVIPGEPPDIGRGGPAYPCAIPRGGVAPIGLALRCAGLTT